MIGPLIGQPTAWIADWYKFKKPALNGSINLQWANKYISG
jgi:hypothetical protein